MPSLFRKKDLEFRDDPDKIDHYRLLSAYPRLYTKAKSKNLVFDLRQLNPGQYSFPYHFHRNAEELMLILSGTMTLRTPKGLEIMQTGDMVFFEMGEEGAHQFYNHSDAPCTYLDIRTFLGMDVTEYPDSGKINVIPAMGIYEKSSKTEYFKGEENVEEIWKKLRKENDRYRPNDF